MNRIAVIALALIVSLALAAPAVLAKEQGPTKVKTTVTMDVTYDEAAIGGAATGKVKSPKVGCRKNREVVVKQTDPNFTLGAAQSGPDGSYSVTWSGGTSLTFLTTVTAVAKTKKIGGGAIKCKQGKSDGFSPLFGF